MRESNIAAVPTFVGIKGKTRVAEFSGADRSELQRLVLQLSGKA